MGFLMRLLRDTRGNTLAMVAAGLIPLLGLIGGGIDMSRIYLTKSRLQQACDAGALAGRKQMGGGAWAANSGIANATANSMFSANFVDNSYGSSGLTKAFTENAGKVNGTASVNLPMTIMRIFGQTNKLIEVTCDAEMRLPNTDVMFVLDVTGSMASKLSGDPDTKIVGLRRAVRCFYEIVARLDTVATCDGGAPSGGTSNEVQIRFGFVPYATNVNLGKLLPSTWFADSWTYQSREIETDHTYGTVTGYYDGSKSDNVGSWSSTQTDPDKISQNACNNRYDDTVGDTSNSNNLGVGKNESNGGVQEHGDWEASQAWRDIQYQVVSWANANEGNNKGICKYKFRRIRTYTRTFTFHWADASDPNAVAFKSWLYHPVTFDISGLKNGSGWRNDYTILLPTADNYNNRNVIWDGCIEERRTVRATNYMPIPSGANDLDLDSTPTSNINTQWAPVLTNVVYARKETYESSSPYTMGDMRTFVNFGGKSYDCPPEGRLLQQWPDASAFDDYVDTLDTGGNTYHDIGLIWGGRLISPTGLFASTNAATPRGGEIQRHLIFMTDGESCTSVNNYQAYGFGWFDRRQTPVNTAPTDGCATTGTLTQQVNARTQAVCQTIRNMPNTTLWVIWFGASNTTIENQLRGCASTDRFFSARNSSQLQSTFRDIANQISQLRLTS